MKVCLVGSSGGHLTHLYMLKPFWKDKEHFWVTFDKEDARSLLEGEKMYPCYYPTNRSLKALIKNVAQRMGTIIPVEDINTLGDIITNYDQIVAGMGHGMSSNNAKFNEELEKLDLICHGVPSPKFFKKYLEYQNKQTAGRVIYFNFRSKDKRGWGTQYLLKTKTKTKTKTLSLDRYGKHFMDGDCYRESCYKCAYANTSRVGDLTVGDFWGIAKSHPSFNSPKGVSSVFVNTEKGQKLFEMMRVLAEVEEATLEEGMVKQHNLVQPSNRPVTRDTFYKSIDEPGFIENIKVGFQPKARLKFVLPNKLIQKIKSLYLCQEAHKNEVCFYSD